MSELGNEIDKKKHIAEKFSNFLTSFIFKLAAIALAIISGIFILIYFLNFSGKMISEISENFRSGIVVNEFNSYVMELKGLNNLQIASLKSLDEFSKKDSKSILWDLVQLPDVVVELRAPVEYNYFINLKEKWEFRWDENDTSIVVVAPTIQCGTPAVDISKMEIYEKEGSFLRNADEVKEKLKSELTATLRLNATEKISVIRETAREETKTFITSWFLNNYFKSRTIKPKNILVYFSDEDLPNSEQNDLMILENKEINK